MAPPESAGLSSQSLDDPSITEAEDFKRRKADTNTTALTQKREITSGCQDRKGMVATSYIAVSSK